MQDTVNTLPNVGDRVHFEPTLESQEAAFWRNFYGDPPANHGEVIEVDFWESSVLVGHSFMGSPQWVKVERIRSIIPPS